MRGFVLASLLLVSCDDVGLGEGSSSLGCDTREEPLDWDNYGQAAVRQHCAHCHSSQTRYLELVEDAETGENVLRGNARAEEVDLNTLPGVLLNAEEVYETVVETTTMPKGGGMTTEQRAEFSEWLRCWVLPVRRDALESGDLEAFE